MAQEPPNLTYPCGCTAPALLCKGCPSFPRPAGSPPGSVPCGCPAHATRSPGALGGASRGGGPGAVGGAPRGGLASGNFFNPDPRAGERHWDMIGQGYAAFGDGYMRSRRLAFTLPGPILHAVPDLAEKVLRMTLIAIAEGQ